MIDELIERCAEKAYIAGTTSVFGVAPGPLSKQKKEESGHSPQFRGVPWDKLPRFAQDQWRTIARAVIEEADREI